MNRFMNNQTLFQKIKVLVSSERKIGVEILELLHEIERRKAYCDLKYDGLYTYCIKELGFSDAQAYHRIQAMRALKEIPEIIPMIQSGSLSMSSVSKVQVHLRKEKIIGKKRTSSEKLELFQSVAHQTSKEVDKTLSALRGEKLTNRLVLELDPESERLWRQVKDLSAQKTKSNAELAFKMLMQEWIRRNDPLLKANARRTVPSSTQVAEQQHPSLT